MRKLKWEKVDTIYKDVDHISGPYRIEPILGTWYRWRLHGAGYSDLKLPSQMPFRTLKAAKEYAQIHSDAGGRFGGVVPISKSDYEQLVRIRR